MKIRYNPQSMFRLSTVVNSVIQILATHIRTCPTNGDQSTCHSKCGECMATDAMQQIHSIYGMNCSLYAAQTNDFSNGCECMPLLSVFACLSLSLCIWCCGVAYQHFLTSHICVYVCAHTRCEHRMRIDIIKNHAFGFMLELSIIFFLRQREKEKKRNGGHMAVANDRMP